MAKDLSGDVNPERASGNVVTMLVADRQPVIRAGLRAVLEETGTCLVTGEAADGTMAVELSRTERPDIVILDADLTDPDAYATTQALKALPGAPDIILSYTCADAFEVHQLVEAGATGFVHKGADASEFSNAVRAVRGGGTYFSGSLMSSLFALQNNALRGLNMFGLTPRETSILRLLADGYSNKEVANRFGLSVRTVETHRLNIRRKTRADTLSDLVRIARALRLQEPRGAMSADKRAASLS